MHPEGVGKADSPITPDRIARQVYGESAKVGGATAISRGEDNDGILVHEVWTDATGSGGEQAVHRILEKRTRNQNERKTAIQLMQRQCEEPYRVFPIIHGVQDDGDAVRIFMEFCPTLSHRKDVSGPMCEAIVDAVWRVNACFRERQTIDGVTGIRDYFLASRKRIAAIGSFLDGASGEAHASLELVDRILAYAGKVPVAICHNDVFWPNLSIADDRDPMACRLIDIGMIGPNLAGGDFHHFARMAFRDKYLGPFHDALTRAYSARSGVRLRDVQFSSFSYALLRSGLRIVTHLNRDVPEKAGRELRAYRWLEDHVRRVIG